MNFLELTKKRFSVRNYKSDRVEQDKIDISLNVPV